MIGEMVKVAVEQYGFVGIKVHRYDARLSREICDVARAFSVPVLYDPIGEVSIVELIATEYPDVAFIIPHMGSFSDDWRAQHSLIDYLVRHPNIYTDTSGVRRFELLEQAVQRAGARKILFGSDGPWLHPGVELEKVRLLGLSPADEQLVLGGNFLRLISKRREQPLALPETRSRAIRTRATASGIPGSLARRSLRSLISRRHCAGAAPRGASAGRDRSRRACARRRANCRSLPAWRCGSRYRPRPG